MSIFSLTQKLVPEPRQRLQITEGARLTEGGGGGGRGVEEGEGGSGGGKAGRALPPPPQRAEGPQELCWVVVVVGICRGWLLAAARWPPLLRLVGPDVQPLRSPCVRPLGSLPGSQVQ